MDRVEAYKILESLKGLKSIDAQILFDRQAEFAIFVQDNPEWPFLKELYDVLDKVTITWEYDIRPYLKEWQKIYTSEHIEFLFRHYSACRRWQNIISKICPQSYRPAPSTFPISNIEHPEQSDQENKSEQSEPDMPECFRSKKMQECLGKAIEHGYMSYDNNKYCWNFNVDGGKTALAYFIAKSLKGVDYQLIEMERYFGIKSLSSLINGAECECKTSKARQWRRSMDDKIFNKK